jgi:2'-5' RNA ligase
MDRPGSVEGRERLRLFCALRLPDDVLDRLVAWQAQEQLDRAGRPVSRDNLHVTLAFLGARPAGELPVIIDALHEAARGAQRSVLRLTRYRETRSVGMLAHDDEGVHATALAVDLHERLERLRVYRREQRPWMAHVTVLRFRDRPRLRPELPDELLAPFSPSEAAVYHSVLRPTGAQYEVLDAVRLGG